MHTICELLIKTVIMAKGSHGKISVGDIKLTPRCFIELCKWCNSYVSSNQKEKLSLVLTLFCLGQNESTKRYK